MKTPKLQAGSPQPRKVQRADLAPSAGYAIVVDGHFKTEFVEEKAAKKAATELLAKYTTHPRSHELWLSSSKPAL
jgi:hypothetical protein